MIVYICTNKTTENTLDIASYILLCRHTYKPIPACVLCQTLAWFRPRPAPTSHSYCYRVLSEVVLFSDLSAVFAHA